MPGRDEMIRVLICDDAADVRTMVGELLSIEPDIELVGEAEDGAQAVWFAEQLQPDVIIIDMRMPGMDEGFAALPVIREVAPDAQVIVWSAFPAADHAGPAKRAGAAAYVEKGSGRNLVDAIRSAAPG